MAAASPADVWGSGVCPAAGSLRFAHFKLLKKADEGLVTISEDGRSPVLTKQMPYVSGLSFGIISAVFSVINILADSIGPSTVGIHGDSPYYFITSASLTMALVFLHMFWGTLFFHACEKTHYWKLALVIVSHLVISGLTFLNPCYEASLIPIFLITISTGVWSFFTAGGSLRNILACLSLKFSHGFHIHGTPLGEEWGDGKDHFNHLPLQNKTGCT